MPGISSYDDGTQAGGGANSEGSPGAVNGSVIKNLAAAAFPGTVFYLIGGYYALSAVASGYGTITLQMLGPDAATWLTAATAIGANGITYAYLPPGGYRWAAASVTAAYATVSRVPVG